MLTLGLTLLILMFTFGAVVAAGIPCCSASPACSRRSACSAP